MTVSRMTRDATVPSMSLAQEMSSKYNEDDDR